MNYPWAYRLILLFWKLFCYISLIVYKFIVLNSRKEYMFLNLFQSKVWRWNVYTLQTVDRNPRSTQNIHHCSRHLSVWTTNRTCCGFFSIIQIQMILIRVLDEKAIARKEWLRTVTTELLQFHLGRSSSRSEKGVKMRMGSRVNYLHGTLKSQAVNTGLCPDVYED